MTCENCYFFKPDENWGGGECRRHAPDVKLMKVDHVAITGDAIWPEVSNDDWCGDFENEADYPPRA